MKKNFKFLFVCTGDTCRSPIANAILKSKVKKLDIKGVTSSSAGLFVSAEKEMSEGSRNALKFLGIHFSKHKAVQISKEIVDKASIVVAMTKDHKESIISKFDCADKTFCLSEFGDEKTPEISDPYGKSKGEYIKCAKLIDYLVEQMLIKLAREEIIK